MDGLIVIKSAEIAAHLVSIEGKLDTIVRIMIVVVTMETVIIPLAKLVWRLIKKLKN